MQYYVRQGWAMLHRSRQYSLEDNVQLTPDIVTCLNLMKIFAQEAPARSLKIENQDPPIIIYTDASDVPDRGDNRWVVGGILFDPITSPHLEFFSWVVPVQVVDTWIQKRPAIWDNLRSWLALWQCPHGATAFLTGGYCCLSTTTQLRQTSYEDTLRKRTHPL